MRGRKPTPTAILRLHGSRRARHRREPEVKPRIPTCPLELDEVARAEWERITRELHRARVITRLDRAALAAYCSAWSRFIQAQQELQKSGPVVKSPSGYPILNPWLSVLNASIKQMTTLLSELGLSPAARTRIRVEPPGPSSELDQFTRDRSLSFQEPEAG